MPTTSTPYAALSHRSSARTVRTSHTCSSGAMRPAIPRTASSAATASARGTRYSDCSSSPAEGVNSSRKCGSRSNHGPGTPSCCVQASAARPRIGCRACVAARAPRASAAAPRRAAASASNGSRCFTHSWSATSVRDHVVKMLTLVPSEVTASRSASTASHGGPFVHGLGHVVGRLDVELERRDDAERAEVHDRSREVGVAALEHDRLAVGGDELDAAHGARERAGGVARSVRAGRHRSRHRDVRQRREVREGEAALVQDRGEVAVADAAGESHHARHARRVDVDGQPIGRDQRALGVGEVVERVPGAERTERARRRRARHGARRSSWGARSARRDTPGCRPSCVPSVLLTSAARATRRRPSRAARARAGTARSGRGRSRAVPSCHRRPAREPLELGA